jgi:hypothetical protein
VEPESEIVLQSISPATIVKAKQPTPQKAETPGGGMFGAQSAETTELGGGKAQGGG